MNRFSKITLVVFFSLIASQGFAKSSGDLNKPQPKNNTDTTVTTTSNIVIFKMIPTPAASTNIGSLKKAGKVARTSTSHS
ncbi:hypothetical protein BH10BAC1_BH10BAC1_18260 [soil metagenome]